MKVLASILLVTIIIAWGCGNGTAQNEPPKIILGQDPCDNCFMLINEIKFAASLRFENGDSKRFDDIGCMIGFVHKTGTKISAYWVYDYSDGETVDAKKAYFIKSDKIITPMSSGIAAFKTKSKAEEYAGKYQSDLIDFENLINNYKSSETEM